MYLCPDVCVREKERGRRTRKRNIHILEIGTNTSEIFIKIENREGNNNLLRIANNNLHAINYTNT